jgi:hypothetical protein
MNPRGPSEDVRPPRLQSLIALGRLREQPSSGVEVAALWRKAVESAHDAELSEISLDGSLRAAYDAGHLACLALLAAHGLRPASGQGHHEITFAGAAALGDPSLADLVPDSEEIRNLRRSSMYDPAIAEESDRQMAVAWVRRTLPAVQSALSRHSLLAGMALERY